MSALLSMLQLRQLKQIEHGFSRNNLTAVIKSQTDFRIAIVSSQHPIMNCFTGKLQYTMYSL